MTNPAHETSVAGTGNSSTPVLVKALAWGALFAVTLGVVGAVIGAIVVGPVGVWSALIGAAMAAVFLGITVGSILLANRFHVAAFFPIVLGAWLLKFILFIVLALVLKDQPWINTMVLFLCLVIGVIGSLVIDVVVVMKTRMPYASDVMLPTGYDESQDQNHEA
ncbi:hypothetical protein [Homoserinimonas sp. OAct 916]|uniref:hypothetical protein n=1 Tax=Homoserinimonas sp. OAct 916 TaxID=2211450 RepID=UPI000DBE799A|nr:hypothetical protein [Homoserinimonas sp. OAct 916]